MVEYKNAYITHTFAGIRKHCQKNEENSEYIITITESISSGM